MKKTIIKPSYNTPTVEVLSARMEAGMQMSGTTDNATGVSTNQYGTGSWDDAPNPSNAPQYS